MASQARVRIEVGFDGGQVMNALVTVESADALQRAFSAASRLSSSSTPRTAPTTSLRRVVYVTRYAREGRVGFGG